MKQLYSFLLVFFPTLFMCSITRGDLPTPPLIALSKSGNCWDQPPVLPPVPCVPEEPSQDSEAVLVVRPYGFIKWEAYFDTRQVLGLREDASLFFPAPFLPDIFGQDINAHGEWNMDAFESRLGVALRGPDWNSFITDAIIEGDFRGALESTIFNFRLRNAFGRIMWRNGAFLFGQWWHPLWIAECFPHTLGFGIGAPIDPSVREPQLRYTGRWEWFELIAAAASQGDFSSNGPIGTVSDYIRDAVIPNLHLQMRAYGDRWLFGAAGDYKRLVPRIVSNDNVKVKEHIDSFIFEAFATFNVNFYCSSFVGRMKAFWAQNGNDQQLISGFGVKTVNPQTDRRTYANTAATGAWFDCSYYFHCDEMELGLFVGGTKNLGAREALYIDPETGQPIIYGLLGVSQNIDYVVDVIPRFVFMKDPVRVGIELQYTRASWGTPNACGRVTNGVPVDNYRIFFVLYYLF